MGQTKQRGQVRQKPVEVLMLQVSVVQPPLIRTHVNTALFHLWPFGPYTAKLDGVNMFTSELFSTSWLVNPLAGELVRS